MVEDMLVLARADAGGYRLHVTSAPLDNLLEECAAAARVLASAAGISFDATLEDGVVAEVDAALVRQLALNLLENAIKHTHRGGRVGMSLRAVSDHAEIAVADTGCGIAAAEREHIFERFVRLDSARHAVGGAGLGLPIARWIAEAHHGTLTLEESGPSGSTFVARLPLARATADSTAEPARRAWDAYARRVSNSKPTVASDAT